MVHLCPNTKSFWHLQVNLLSLMVFLHPGIGKRKPVGASSHLLAGLPGQIVELLRLLAAAGWSRRGQGLDTEHSNGSEGTIRTVGDRTIPIPHRRTNGLGRS